MSRTERLIKATPEAVWGVLADPDAYAHWVVGSKDIRDADAAWPADGSRFHHTVGVGPLSIQDHTEVVRAEPPHRLLLHAKARPAGRAKVELLLVRRGDDTLVEMREEPASLLGRLGHNPLADKLLHGRNIESLRRLAELAETGRPSPETTRDRTGRDRTGPGGGEG
jgi:uncharacterized protein YndB with AHSA1/START domain